MCTMRNAGSRFPAARGGKSRCNMPTPSINFDCFCYVLNILLSNRLGKAVPETWYFPVCLQKRDRDWRSRARFGGKSTGFCTRIADGG